MSDLSHNECARLANRIAELDVMLDAPEDTVVIARWADDVQERALLAKRLGVAQREDSPWPTGSVDPIS
jgi:hypothetical protein